MAQLVDSSVFIAIERRRLGLDVLARITEDPDAALSSMTVSELLVGVHRSDSAERRRLRELFVEGVINTFPVIPFDVDVARTHARLSARLTMAGTKIDAHDLVIGATALTHEYSVLTDNVRDFGRVPDLIVRQPAWTK